MRKVITDIGDVADVHRTFVEYLRDTNQSLEPMTDMWLFKFADPNFFCHVFKHGRAVVGMYWGSNIPYFKEPTIQVDGLFVRRSFRGKIRYIRGMVVELNKLMTDNKTRKLFLAMPKARADKRKIIAKTVVTERTV